MSSRSCSAEHLASILEEFAIKVADIKNFRGPVTLEPHCQLGGRVQFPPCAIGAYSFTQSGRFNNVEIGRYCSIAPDVVIGAPEHPTDWVSTSPFQWNPEHLSASRQGEMRRRSFDGCQPVIVGHDVWIGQNTIITGGVTIGTGAVVAAGAVVTKNVAPYAIVGGVPAKVIRYRFSKQQIDRLLESHWWDYKASDVARFECTRVEIFLDQFTRQKENLRKYRPEILTISRSSRGFILSTSKSGVL